MLEELNLLQRKVFREGEGQGLKAFKETQYISGGELIFLRFCV